MRLGLDLGGTKIAAVVLAEDGTVRWESRVAAPRGSYSQTIEALAALVDAGERAVGATCTVGVGTPGAISPASGLVKNANSTWLNGRPLREDLAVRLGREVRVANDANCLAVSEAVDGAAAGARVAFGVILGTGVGGGLALDGRAWTGANAIAGEWGHNPLPWPGDDERPGPACYCGQRGCLETWLSGPGVAADDASAGRPSRTAEQIVEAAARGDAIARATLDRWLDRLARALATVVNVIDPEVIVVGGGLSRVSAIYDDVPRRWGAWVFSDRVETPVVPARFGDASGVRGAAWLFHR
jgi:fructokinase